MNNKSFLSYNILYDPILTPEQIKACHFYLTPNFDLNAKPNHVVFVNQVCQTFGMTVDELAWALSRYRLYSNDILCVHCGAKYLLKEPVGYHEMPYNWENWICDGCHNFLSERLQLEEMLDIYPSNDDDMRGDDDQEHVPPWY